MESSQSERSRFFDGFHHSISAFANTGSDLLVEHIVEEQIWADDLKAILSPFDTFWVGIHCDLETLEKRESLRGDRSIGEAKYHIKTHQFQSYDLEADGTLDPADSARLIHQEWKAR